MKKALLILVAGGTASGKSEFVKWFHNDLLISMDRFYLPLEKVKKDENGNLDFDHPESLGIEECAKAIKNILSGKIVEVPIYDYLKNDRVGLEKIKLKKNTRFILVEGMFAFYPPLREMADIRIFMDTPAELRVARRMIRDMKRKKRTHKETLADFIHTEERYQKFVLPTKKYADIVIPFSHNPLQFLKSR